MIVFLLFLPGMALYVRKRKSDLKKQREGRMRQEFLDGMQFAGTALQSGYAMENAFSEALTELRKIYDEDSFIIREFGYIALQIRMNVPVEKLLMDLGRRSHIDDIRNFADVFLTARKTGGDMIAIVRTTIADMRQKDETRLEIETVLGEGSIHAKMGLSCADCHMEKGAAEDGTEYPSHYLQSPLASEALLETCAQCHKDTDMAEKVHTLQAEITAREKEVGQELSDLKDKLAEAVAGGEYSEEELDAIRGLHRTAQWFFDYDYVENSEGAHNSTLAKRCLDTAEETIQEAMGLFKS